MTLHADVVAAFAAALADFPVDHDHPDDAYVQKEFDTIVTILYSLKYDTVGESTTSLGSLKTPLSTLQTMVRPSCCKLNKLAIAQAPPANLWRLGPPGFSGAAPLTNPPAITIW